MARLAKSLVTLRDQINKLSPKRSKAADGWIGDAAHSARKSDHNPVAGVVHAIDLTHDPGGGLDSYKLAETLRQNRDPRIKYVISAGKIFAGPSGPKPWVWRTYTGSNAHRQHVHVSVNQINRDDGREWKLDGGPVITAPTKSTPPTLWRGAKGEHVKKLQEWLNLVAIEIDGDFGKKTEAAVRAFQKKKGLVVDGVVGTNTWLALLS